MSFWDRLFGKKSVSYVGTSTPDSVAGYPSLWGWSDSYSALYRSQPSVRTVVDFIATNFAQLNPKVYQRLEDNDRRDWFDHPVAELLRNPNPTVSRYNFYRATQADLCIYDRAYWKKERKSGLVRALVRIPPSRLDIVFDQDTMKSTYRFKGEVISRDEMVVFSGYHPDGSDGGVSPLETLRRVLAEDWASQNSRELYWRNGAKIPGWAERPLDAPEWNPDARDVFLQDLKLMTTGANSGSPVLFEDGIKWKTGEVFSAQDSQYLDGRKLHYREVAQVYAPSLVGLITEDLPGNAVESFHRQLYQDVLAPRCRAFQDEIDLQLLRLEEFDMGDAYCEINLAEKLKGSFEEQGRALVTAVGVPYLSINEGRTRLNLPRIDNPDFDVPIQPMNVIYGGQPAVTMPTADPSTPPSTASADYAAKLAGFYDRQERSVCSRLGDKAWSEVAVYAMWDDDRWNREHPNVDGPAENGLVKEKVAAAFAAGGVPAVHMVYATLKDPIEVSV